MPESQTKFISPLYPTSQIKIVSGQAKQSPSLHNFVPRIGGAYRLGTNFVVRGGYGIYTATNGRYARAQGVGPYQLSETFFNAVQNGQPLFAFPNPFPAGAGTIASQSISGFPTDTRNGRIHQFSFTLERQVHSIGLRLSYQGSRSRGMNYSLNINKPQPSLTAFTQARRPYPQFVNATYVRTDGAANFNALTFEVQRKVGQVTFDAHWSWCSNLNNMLNTENPYAPLFWNRDAGTARHRAVLHTIWELPFGPVAGIWQCGAPVDFVLGGWQLYWIAYLETGQYFSPSYSGADPSNTNTSGGLPDRIANGNLDRSERQLTRWFDATAFARPPAGRFGNSGVNICRPPVSTSTTLPSPRNLPLPNDSDLFLKPPFRTSSIIRISTTPPRTSRLPDRWAWSVRSRPLRLPVKSCCEGVWNSKRMTAPVQTLTGTEKARIQVPAAAAGRLVSLDAFRGFVMFWIIGGSALIRSLPPGAIRWWMRLPRSSSTATGRACGSTISLAGLHADDRNLRSFSFAKRSLTQTHREILGRVCGARRCCFSWGRCGNPSVEMRRIWWN